MRSDTHFVGRFGRRAFLAIAVAGENKLPAREAEFRSGAFIVERVDTEEKPN